ncbi:MAG: response regulator transcription factor [Bdellovibrionales bacterium]|nr:response regulator transcription factor [Bdellovibrionales bacterium]
MKALICLVEDEPTISKFVADRLAREGYQVSAFRSAEEAIASERIWDLYILDVMLEGDLSGLQLCAHLREHDPNLPILMLSALAEANHRIEGLRIGADDYLTKPFEMEELLLRVSAMLRRRGWYSTLPDDTAVYRWNDKWVDFRKFEAGRGRKKFELTQKECMLMKLLIEKKGEVVTRSEILDKVWGYNVFPSSRTVDNFILRLRKYFESDPSAPSNIHAVRGLGYKFTPEAT